jgi:protein phosphatase
VKAPEKSSPSARYQHSSLFVGSLMLIIGGKTNNVAETLPLEVFDTETSEWFAYNTVQRFRHGSWVHEKNLYIYGGFELSSPTLPTDTVFKINLSQLFKNNPALYGKVVDLNSSVSSVSSNNSAITSNRSENTRTDTGQGQRSSNIQKEALQKIEKT